MKKLLIVLVLLSILFIAGCTTTSTTTGDVEVIEDETEATETLINVSSGVGDIESTLENIDDLLG